MLCFGIETSCDDTSLALVRDGSLVAHKTSSQANLHALFGGVVPEMASREHARLLGPLCDALFEQAGLLPSQVEVVAAARGPGLLGSLLVGVAFGKAFALGVGARFLGINHLHAHIFAAGMENELVLPALALLVSGGHTHLYRVEAPDRLIALGKTLDDAAGEAFDKAGKMLGLPYPSGRYIDLLASEGEADAKRFPRPYLDNDSLDFSFSGLKTAMATFLASSFRNHKRGWDVRTGVPDLPEGAERKALADVCASYRLAVVETLLAKVRKALQTQKQPVQSLVLAGGVAANSLLRASMRDLALEHALHFAVPPPDLCTDNAAMIAFLGDRLARQGYEHPLDMETIPRGRRVPEDMRRRAE